MLLEPASESKSPWQNPLLYSYAALVIVLLAVGVIMYARWEDARRMERAAVAERAEKQREADQATVEQLGGNNFAILDFYASPRAIHRGESARLCYGVSNAKSVTLEPQPRAVWPSPANCVDVSPVKTTTYTLTIQDVKGNSKSQTVDVTVH